MYTSQLSYNSDTVLYQFSETGTSDRNIICRDQLLDFSPLSFYLNSPLKAVLSIWLSSLDPQDFSFLDPDPRGKKNNQKLQKKKFTLKTQI